MLLLRSYDQCSLFPEPDDKATPFERAVNWGGVREIGETVGTADMGQ